MKTKNAAKNAPRNTFVGAMMARHPGGGLHKNARDKRARQKARRYEEAAG
jgi:hypothetical protein